MIKCICVSECSRKRLYTALITVCTLFVGTMAYEPPARADIVNFDMAGSIYTKWLYRNDDTSGVLTYGNPFWEENQSGQNGVGSEFELKIYGTVSKVVEADVRIKSRFGSVWQDWWESGNVSWDENNTSGESLGMDHAEYIKLRGYHIRIMPPYEFIRQINVGSSDFGMFNPWTVGRVRYIDRDNGKGVFFEGAIVDDTLDYLIGAIALSKLWAGPGWSTGLGDPALDDTFWSNDWAYALKLTLDTDAFQLTSNTYITRDIEIDLTDPDSSGSLYPTCQDALGNPIEGCENDHGVSYAQRYSNIVSTLELNAQLLEESALGDLLAYLLLGFSYSNINPEYMSNGVALNNGVSPLPYKDTLISGNGAGDFFDNTSILARFEFIEAFGLELLNFKLEYFYVGDDWVSMLASRRESDVLLTDGFIEGGQIPNLNLANEFQDFDEPFYESIIGWHGITALFELDFDQIFLTLEYTPIWYASNEQDRDVAPDEELGHVGIYPDFLHESGYTDTDLYDYANVGDRGRDPRAVYHANQERFTHIGVLKAEWTPEALDGFKLEAKVKYIFDADNRDRDLDFDNYTGHIITGRLKAKYALNDEIGVTLGGQYDYWNEDNRSGNPSQGYYSEYITTKIKAFGGFTFQYGGVNFGYIFQFVHKDQDRDPEADRLWNVFRSKAFLSVAW